MSLGTNGAAAAQLEDPKHENEFAKAQADAQAEEQAQAEADAKDQPLASDASDGALMAAAASDSPAQPAA